ncbi:SIR2 family protein [uncultured Imperialibacter sp.]|uniref:SIR2 family protein n=1 Tax=uncultured Imperialibacter sp. TaxID=1672639 RepID=UPI0030D981DA|tara:strand:- start:1542 stop:2762 length:1221 start_codon:yes stop_codon:yes gene_type:complete
MEYIYINAGSSVAIEKSEDGKQVEKIFIDGKQHKFEDGDVQDKEQFAAQMKRNKYQKFLNRQFENLLVLTGAGSSVSVGEGEKKGRLLSQLWDDTRDKLGENKLNAFCELVKYSDKKDDAYVKNLEKLLSVANAAKDFVTSTKDINIPTIIEEIEALIKEKCELKLPHDAPHHAFIEKITRRKVTLPRAKVFTLNYDTLFEQAGRKGNFTIIDGFSFSFPRYFSGRNFDYDVVLRDKSRLKEEDNFINRVFHLYKPHGSVDWEKTKEGVKQADSVKKALMIYPKDSKYESSYEQPFFEMMSRFQQNLRRDNVLLICIGFSFNDKHIVTAIQEALEQNSGFQIMVLNKGIDTSSSFKWLFDLSMNHSNIVLMDELFSDFALNYPTLKSYNQDEYKKITINLSDSDGE